MSLISNKKTTRIKQTVLILLLLNTLLCPLVRAETPSPHANEMIEVAGTTAIPDSNAGASIYPRITLVLGGGGCKSLAQIGVLKVFEKNHIPISYIVGTSAGAIIGALYAAHVPLDDIQALAENGKLQSALTYNFVLRFITLPFIKLIHFGNIYAGLSSGYKLEKFLRKQLPGDFSDLKIPFAAVATDLESGNTCVISSGDVSKAVVASSAVPVLIRPVTLHDRIFIDGGIKANLPTNCAQLTKADLIVAVPADSPIRNVKKKDFRSMRNLTMRVIDIMEVEIDKHRWDQADLVIYPNVADVSGITKDPEMIRKAVAEGETAATEALPRLQALIKKKIAEKQK